MCVRVVHALCYIHSIQVRRVCYEGSGGIKAQYHFAGGEGHYFQLPPYAYDPNPPAPPAATSTENNGDANSTGTKRKVELGGLDTGPAAGLPCLVVTFF
jgi:hypothetical protein